MMRNWTIIPALIALLACVMPAPAPDPAVLDPAPYDRIVARSDWSDVRGHRLAFCILGLNGEERGRTLAAYELSAGEWSRVFLDRDRGFHPWRIMTAELDGDPLPEVAVGAYKPTRYDPRPANRLFIFDWTGEELFAKWLGSRLGLPFESFTFARSADGIDRLLAVEHFGHDRLVLRQYHWDGFGFAHDVDLIRVSHFEDYEKTRDALMVKMKELQEKGVGP